MTSSAVMAPDERALRAALETGRFKAGAASGKWRLVKLEWPEAVFAVAAAPRDGSPNEFGLRLNLEGYPQQAPTATPWHLGRNEKLASHERPKGARATKTFRTDWKGGDALYTAYDREGLATYPDWASRYPLSAWHAERDVTFFLERVHELLNAADYEGI